MQSATIFFALAAVVASVSAGGHGGHLIAAHPVVTAEIYSRPAYKYSYSVSDAHTGDQKSASEVRDGDLTKGSYSLVQPDGVLRTVNYVSTPLGGFQAQVINTGAAGHPGRAVIAAPIVAAPIVAKVAPVAVALNGLGYGYGLNGGVALNGLGYGGYGGYGYNGLAYNNLGYGSYGYGAGKILG